MKNSLKKFTVIFSSLMMFVTVLALSSSTANAQTPSRDGTGVINDPTPYTLESETGPLPLTSGTFGTFIDPPGVNRAVFPNGQGIVNTTGIGFFYWWSQINNAAAVTVDGASANRHLRMNPVPGVFTGQVFMGFSMYDYCAIPEALQGACHAPYLTHIGPPGPAGNSKCYTQDYNMGPERRDDCFNIGVPPNPQTSIPGWDGRAYDDTNYVLCWNFGGVTSKSYSTRLCEQPGVMNGHWYIERQRVNSWHLEVAEYDTNFELTVENSCAPTNWDAVAPDPVNGIRYYDSQPYGTEVVVEGTLTSTNATGTQWVYIEGTPGDELSGIPPTPGYWMPFPWSGTVTGNQVDNTYTVSGPPPGHNPSDPANSTTHWKGVDLHITEAETFVTYGNGVTERHAGPAAVKVQFNNQRPVSNSHFSSSDPNRVVRWNEDHVFNPFENENPGPIDVDDPWRCLVVEIQEPESGTPGTAGGNYGVGPYRMENATRGVEDGILVVEPPAPVGEADQRIIVRQNASRAQGSFEVGYRLSDKDHLATSNEGYNQWGQNYSSVWFAWQRLRPT